MILEQAVYDINKNIIGYLIFYQNVKDSENKEEFIGFKRVVK